jgi:hypothetical protein
MAMAWQQLSASQRSTIKQSYQAAGIKLLVSAFGGTEQPTTSGASATQLASTMAAWVKEYDVDGIDVDYEDETAMNKGDGSAENWIIEFNNALRSELPQGQYILTHAPQAPWMGTNSMWASGAYITVNKQVGSSIDWYNVQFYNQGASEYITCDGLLTASSSSNPKSSVFEIAANGFDLNKIVIGKPGSTADAGSGQMSTSTLASCVSQAKAKGWNAGVMSWEYPDANSAWITAVRGSAYPVGASSDSGSDSSSSSTPTASSSAPGSTDGVSSTDENSSGTATTSTPASGSTAASTDNDSDNGSTGATGTSSDSNSSSPSTPPADVSSSADTASPTTSADNASPTDASSTNPSTGTSAPSTGDGDGDDSSTPTSTATYNNGMWTPTPTAGDGTTYNNGMWTPSPADGAAAAATATGTGTGKHQKKSHGNKSQSESRRSRMVRRRAPGRV